MTRKSTKSCLEPDWSAKIVAVRETRDEAAFAELFAHFAPRIKGFLIKSGASPTLAEECSQEAMVTLWNKAHLFDPTRASAATWIFTIARNKKIDAFRRAARPEPEDLPWGPEPEPEAADAMVIQQETQKLAKALEDLPQKQRDIVRRAYFGDLTHAELAEETGLPLGTIKSRIRLALTRLRQTLSE
jgi:RNA polymerase sigma-70 factor (ECF subfamily)